MPSCHRPAACALSLALVITCAHPARADEWWGRDKALHFGFSAAIAAGGYGLSAPFFEARYPPLLLGAGLSLAAGAAKELADLAGAGDPSWKDFTWDVLGAASGLLLAWSLDLAIRGVSSEHPAFGKPEGVRRASIPVHGLTLVF